MNKINLTVDRVEALEQEAAQAGDDDTVRDCQHVAEWLRTLNTHDEVATEQAYDRLTAILRNALAQS